MYVHVYCPEKQEKHLILCYVLLPAVPFDAIFKIHQPLLLLDGQRTPKLDHYGQHLVGLIGLHIRHFVKEF